MGQKCSVAVSRRALGASSMAQREEGRTGGVVRGDENGNGSSRGDRHHVSALTKWGVRFTAAEGDYVYWEDELGNRRRALDLAAGPGALLGHNRAELVTAALRHFHERRPVLLPGA